jgi:REP element-mobilizing transposase RayT
MFAPHDRVSGYPQHLRTFDYIGVYRYFLTFCTFERNRLFVEADAVSLAHAQICALPRPRAFLFMRTATCPITFIFSLKPSATAVISSASSHARTVFRLYFKRAMKQTLWQRYGYERVLRNESETIIVARYVVENPVRAGLVESPLDYPFWGSSTCPREDLLEHV